MTLVETFHARKNNPRPYRPRRHFARQYRVLLNARLEAAPDHSRGCTQCNRTRDSLLLEGAAAIALLVNQ